MVLGCCCLYGGFLFFGFIVFCDVCLLSFFFVFIAIPLLFHSSCGGCCMVFFVLSCFVLVDVCLLPFIFCFHCSFIVISVLSWLMIVVLCMTFGFLICCVFCLHLSLVILLSFHCSFVVLLMLSWLMVVVIHMALVFVLFCHALFCLCQSLVVFSFFFVILFLFCLIGCCCSYGYCIHSVSFFICLLSKFSSCCCVIIVLFLMRLMAVIIHMAISLFVLDMCLLLFDLLCFIHFDVVGGKGVACVVILVTSFILVVATLFIPCSFSYSVLWCCSSL